MNNKYVITESNLKKFSDYDGVNLQDLKLNLLSRRTCTVKDSNGKFWKLVPNGMYFSAYKTK